MERHNKILHYWFGDITEEGLTKENRGKFWFAKNPEVDSYIKENFENDLKLAEQDKLDWKENPKGVLALIILLDQFSRNIYRNTKEQFSNDNKALELTLEAIAKGMDKKLALVERLFLYMPLMHSEKIEIQEKSLFYFKQLQKDAQGQKGFSMKYVIQHYNIIKKFNRFPHRNKILNRESIKEELEHLEKHSGF